MEKKVEKNVIEGTKLTCFKILTDMLLKYLVYLPQVFPLKTILFNQLKAIAKCIYVFKNIQRSIFFN